MRWGGGVSLSSNSRPESVSTRWSLILSDIKILVAPHSFPLAVIWIKREFILLSILYDLFGQLGGESVSWILDRCFNTTFYFLKFFSRINFVLNEIYIKSLVCQINK